VREVDGEIVRYSLDASSPLTIDDVFFSPKLHRRYWFYPRDDKDTSPPTSPPSIPLRHGENSGPIAGFLACDPEKECPGDPFGRVMPPEINPTYHDTVVEKTGFGFDTFFDLTGADLIANTADDPGLYVFGEYADYRWGLKKVRGAAGGSGTTQFIGPWLPENTIHPRAVLSHKANPLRGAKTQSIYTSTGTANRRFYTRSQDLAGLNPSPMRDLLWLGDSPQDGYTDLVDPFPAELDHFWDTDFYFTAPTDLSFGGVNPPTSNPNQKFGGDYNGIIPCWPPKRAPFSVFKDNREVMQTQIDGESKGAGCIPFSNIRVTGGKGELPLRPAPDRSNLFADFDPRYAQGLYVPSPGLLAYMESGGDFDNHHFNIDQSDRKWNRGQSQRDNKELKEAYIDAEFLDSRLWLRLGLQNIVWGKTELFRTTDQFNPIDIALAGPLAGLEESRVGLWSARMVYSLYAVGPLEDVRFEFAVNLDDFEPIDLGACGEPYTINFVCSITTGIFAHGLLGIGVAGIDRPESFWKDAKGLEGGPRIEWRWDRFSFALTDFYGYNDIPYPKAIQFFDRSVEYRLKDPVELIFEPGAGRPLAAGFGTGCTGEWSKGGGEGIWASASRDPRSYLSTTQAGIGRDPACLKPGGTAGGLNQNGFTVARYERDSDDEIDPFSFARGDVTFVEVNEFGNPLPGPGSLFIEDRGDIHVRTLVPIVCDPGETRPEGVYCEPMRYEVGLTDPGINGERFADGWSPQNALENLVANQQSFATICAATLTIGAALDPGACAFNLFSSPAFLSPGILDIPMSEVVTCVLAGEMDNDCATFMGTISNNLQGFPQFREVNFVSLNRDANDGIITATSTQINRDVDAARCRLPIQPGSLPICPSFDYWILVMNQQTPPPVEHIQHFLPGDEDLLTLDSTLTNEQRALLGCGPYYGTRCDTSVKDSTVLPFAGRGAICTLLNSGCVEGGGIDFLHMEASALTQSWVGFEGTDLNDAVYTSNPDHPEYAQWAAGGENFADTPYAGEGIWLTTSGLPQPGTIEFSGGPTCTRFVEERNDVVVLPGCRGASAVVNREVDFATRNQGLIPTGELSCPPPGLDDFPDQDENPRYLPLCFEFDDGYDPDVDGCVLGQRINDVYVAGRYADGRRVELESCFEDSTHKAGGYYVWNEGVKDEDDPSGSPDLVKWDRRRADDPNVLPSVSPLSRSGSGTLWHPYAGCFVLPSQAVGISPCIAVPKTNVDEVNATNPALAERLGYDGKGVRLPSDTSRDFEGDFFWTNEMKDPCERYAGRDDAPDIPCGFFGLVNAVNWQSQIFRSELAAVSFNFMQFLVQASCNDENDDILNDPKCFDPRTPWTVGKCSYATPQICANVKAFFGAAGVMRNTVRAGGNGRFGRRTFLWHSGGEVVLQYQKRNVLGFSMDFGEDRTKSNWGVEFTWVNRQNFIDSDNYETGVTQSGVLNLTVSADRPTFINFLNQNRTFFLNTQWFFQYIIDHDSGFAATGPLNVLFTVAIFTGYFQDRLNPQLVTVYDFKSGSGGVLPSVTYRFTDALSVGIGMSFFFGRTDLMDMPLREFAPAGNRAGEHAYQNGVDHAISSFRDKDEIWLKLRWTF
jgi:hypothetical protein